MKNPELRRAPEVTPKEQLKKEVERTVYEKYFRSYLEHGTIIAEGMNGFIIRVETDEDHNVLNNILSSQEIAPQENTVTKLLKVSNQEALRHEFAAQNEAHDIIEEQDNKEDLAVIPKAYKQQTISIDEDSKELLRSKYRLSFSEEAKLNVFLMDEIKGEDMQTVMYREILKRKSESLNISEEDVNKMHPSILFSTVDNLLQLTKVEGGLAEQIVTQRENGKTITSFLKKLPEDSGSVAFKEKIQHICLKVSASIKVLHSEGVYHRDLHTRNIMIDEDNQVYLIDFGTALIDRKKRVSDPYENGLEIPYYSDETTTGLYLKAVETEKQRLNEAEKKIVQTWGAKLKQIKSRPQLAEKWSAIEQNYDSFAETVNRSEDPEKAFEEVMKDIVVAVQYTLKLPEDVKALAFFEVIKRIEDPKRQKQAIIQLQNNPLAGGNSFYTKFQIPFKALLKG